MWMPTWITGFHTKAAFQSSFPCMQAVNARLYVYLCSASSLYAHEYVIQVKEKVETQP